VYRRLRRIGIVFCQCMSIGALLPRVLVGTRLCWGVVGVSVGPVPHILFRRENRRDYQLILALRMGIYVGSPAKRVRDYRVRGTILDFVIRESEAFTRFHDSCSNVYCRKAWYLPSQLIKGS
jgi:hypothetical protein